MQGDTCEKRGLTLCTLQCAYLTPRRHLHVHAVSFMQMCDLLTHRSVSELKRGANASSSDSSKPCQQKRINHIKKKIILTIDVYICTRCTLYMYTCTSIHFYIDTYLHVPLQRAEPHYTYQLSAVHTNGRETPPHTSLCTRTYTHVYTHRKKRINSQGESVVVLGTQT